MTERETGEQPEDAYTFYFGKRPDPASKFVWEAGDFAVFKSADEAESWLHGDDDSDS